ncbi:MAG: peptidoglycan editing factor PgeF [Gammaproteobacteria bacterium]|nr:peptidoglycan editing factor PgeF [Gammaproteobacteria bacterium]
MHTEFIIPDWQVPARVRALTTTRAGGVSRSPWESFNLADHVGDDPASVLANRKRLGESAGLPAEPVWLNQVHGVAVVDAAVTRRGVSADGSFSRQPGVVCAVMTADCLPVFLCDDKASSVAVLHAGWRGLAQGIIETGVAAMAVPTTNLMAWLGPAIGPLSFEVGEEVRQAFLDHSDEAARAFQPGSEGKWLADIYALARLRLQRLGVNRVSGGNFCTFQEGGRFFSYRRDNQCGRMASLIWLEENN